MGNAKCSYCAKSFIQRKHLYAHVRNIHHKQPAVCTNKSKNSVICASCSNICISYSDLRDHMIVKHDIKIFKEEISFENKSDFLLWKNGKEKEMQCSYVKRSGVKIRSAHRKEYYVCRRSYLQEKYKLTTMLSSQKIKSAQGLVKLSYSCPSTVQLIEKDGQYKATIFFPHFGHECSLKHINLSAVERTQIAGKIAEGVSFERILNDIRNSITSDDPLERIHLLDRQDLRNIKRQFNLSPQYHQNDVISVELLVKHLQTLKTDCPVLYYKKQGVEDGTKFFEKADFFLAIMTSFQKSIAEKFATQKVCIDSTHGTTGYDFLLTTLLTVDEFGEGVPIAFLISNRADTPTLSFFFELVKQKIGFCIQTDVFMSDDAPEFFNAWLQVMQSPKYHLLCVWHVDRNWRTNISQKVEGDQELKASVYKKLRCLMETEDEHEFNELLPQVLNNFFLNESTKVFGKYFNEYYANRAQQWAFCYRRGLGINTNMFLESMHKVLKHIYLEGKKTKRVDKCIQALICMVRDQMFKRLKKTIKGKCSYRINLIHASHKKSSDIRSSDITEISPLSWKVKSTNQENDYMVQKNNSQCLNDHCQLVCRYCQICVHMYTCTCLDNFIKGNICKHIHAICVKTKLDLPDSSKPDLGINDDEQLQLQTFASQHSQLRGTDCNLKIKMKLDMLYSYISENSYDQNTLLKLEKALDSALSIANTGESDLAEKTIREPVNKNMEKQMRFKSTKKKRRPVTHSLKKPTNAEKKSVKEDVQCQFSIVSI